MPITDEIPAPWKITDTGSAFKITDGRGRSVAFVYYRREDALKSEYLTREQALVMAQAVARLSLGSRQEPPRPGTTADDD